MYYLNLPVDKQAGPIVDVTQPFPPAKNVASGNPQHTHIALTNELQSQLQGVVIFDISYPARLACVNKVFLSDWLYPILLFAQAFSHCLAIFSANCGSVGRNTSVQLWSYQFKVHTSLPLWSPARPPTYYPFSSLDAEPITTPE